ncbi:MAG: STAS/SEC14 domain-containing protein [Lentimicrobiaceae bacterium]|nr:STAS/SEC14 domain-containing protein [Lentimicrobiaceae bacterium]HPG33715.1 hypothetical protein [Lentimicrobium sp.]
MAQDGMKNYTISVDDKLKIIRYRHTGNIPRKELGEAWTEILNIDEFTQQEFHLLADYRGATFNFSIDETKAIDQFLIAHKALLKGKKEALIVDNPFTTVVAILFEDKLYAQTGFEIKAFSTEHAAIRWLIG